ncbi:hypothetical protein EZS27_000300 [termite gut metagenome]|jgi:nicotinamide riboside transporter PnuC|uniref:Uncharacterized protein n=1 Tax=termite gut metagenome TaxID=433724 RepID=A0A5J4T4C7_9ZZZZ
MKNTTITVKRKKTEIKTWIVCFLVANLANLYAIIVYDNTFFTELLTSLGYVVVASFALYFLWSIIRVIFYGLKRLIKSKI